MRPALSLAVVFSLGAGCTAFTAAPSDGPRDGGVLANEGGVLTNDANASDGALVDGGAGQDASEPGCLDLTSTSVTFEKSGGGVAQVVGDHLRVDTSGNDRAVAWLPFANDAARMTTKIVVEASLELGTLPAKDWVADIVGLVEGAPTEANTAPAVSVHFLYGGGSLAYYSVAAFPAGLDSSDTLLADFGEAKAGPTALTMTLQVTWMGDSAAAVSTIGPTGQLAPFPTNLPRNDKPMWSVRIGGYPYQTPKYKLDVTRVCVLQTN